MLIETTTFGNKMAMILKPFNYSWDAALQNIHQKIWLAEDKVVKLMEEDARTKPRKKDFG